ncbi:MAG: cyclic nucleotide-binding domain-containing protein [Muribaculaceae bacterium]|nr:cyclic nucleotide-binding domain-containing protein [Muribaculaceae bacterium]
MATTFETLMDLPLFKGVSKAQISEFLGTTPVDFITYQAGEKLFDASAECRSLIYVMHGSVCITYREVGKGITIHEKASSGRVLGAGRLFGLSRHYGCECLTLEPTGVMIIEKQDYARMLQRNQVYWINYINYLSAQWQRTVDEIRCVEGGSLLNRLAVLVLIYTDPEADSITVEADDEALLALTNLSADDLEAETRRLHQTCLVYSDGIRRKIPSRQRLLEAARIR